MTRTEITMAELTFNQQLQKYRVMIARVIWIALIVFLFVYKRTPVMPLDSAVGILGIVVTLLGVTVRSLSAGALRKNEVLATEGIYAIVRNPLYLGSLLMIIGVNIIVAHWLMAIVSAFLFVITYVPTILNEEKGLLHAYGEEWIAYTKRAPRLFPNLLNLGELANHRWSARQWYKNHEHNTVIAAIAVLLVLHFYQRYLAIQ
jgi:protein-S-isoprenylcysteine O-methyltransferase Ste14